jgi:uncharacterized membrane protein HdeD (DUF308 family)
MQNKFYFIAISIILIGLGVFAFFSAVRSRRTKYFAWGAFLILVGIIMLTLTHYLGDLSELMNGYISSH